MALSMNDGKDWPDRKQLIRFANNVLGVTSHRVLTVIGECVDGVVKTLHQIRIYAADNSGNAELCSRKTWEDAIAQLENGNNPTTESVAE
jgi:hypothetical protein